MEKRTPHTRLSQVKKLVNAGQVRTTRSALLNADELGLDFDGMCNVIIGLSESDFYKSMTTYSDHTIWQDVYRPRLVTGQVLRDPLIISPKRNHV
ncbi:type II toxin-antitoxin system MqsR family toxin [Escherichia coli]|uniref:type II toxin-antitoxin system MqsR family toxin n=1 Tax=Escherichia coli TaxID=562 RepID=UPI0007E50720|nr:type II toxin-antitoxin system MqsR family toxin [Escherichia coli]